MNSTDTTRTVREWAVEVPGATRYFEKLGIDYCCGGGRPLADACAERGIDVANVVTTLELLGETLAGSNQAADAPSMSLSELADHIVDTHHAFTKRELERVDALFAKVCDAHGERHPELFKLRRVFSELSADLVPHMLREEQVLFPFIRALDAAERLGEPRPTPFFGTVQNPIRVMSTEHDAAGELLAELSRLSDSYTPPEDVCMSYQALFSALEQLERDLHEHIHKENNILFPRAIDLESR